MMTAQGVPWLLPSVTARGPRNEDNSPCLVPISWYDKGAMGKSPKRLPFQAEVAQRQAAAMANQTKGRKTNYKNKKKEASRKACRGGHHE
jgi:hypothetical protein